jgi:hypothetical protein
MVSNFADRITVLGLECKNRKERFYEEEKQYPKEDTHLCAGSDCCHRHTIIIQLFFC